MQQLADLGMKITFSVLWTEAPVSMCSSPSYYLKLWYLPPLPLPAPSGHYGVDPNFAIFTRERGDGGKPENAGFLGIKGSGLGLRGKHNV